MRILQVIHTFMPESQAGSEIYTYLLAKALQERHQVAIYYRVADPSRPEHELQESSYQGIPVYRLVNNFTWSRSTDFDYFDPGQEAAFRRALDSFRPDMVHFQHLGAGLSTSLPTIARQQGLPSILHLHDYWYLCPKSHLIGRDGLPCPGPEGGLRCATCPMRPATSQTLRQRLRTASLRSTLRYGPSYLADQLGLSRLLFTESYRKLCYMARDTYFRHMLSGLDALVSPSLFLRDLFVQWGISETKIHLIRNGVDPSRFAGMQEALPNGPLLQVVFVGQIAPHKGLGVLISAMNQLVDAPIALRIYGNNRTGDAASYARQLESQCEHPRVSFEGPYAYDEIGQVLSRADVVVAPSVWYENSPLAIQEALYARRPVVTSDIGGMAELVQDGVNGRTFRMGDAAHLAEILRHLARDRDSLLGLQSAIKPPKTVAEVLPEIESCYNDVLRARHAIA